MSSALSKLKKIFLINILVFLFIFITLEIVFYFKQSQIENIDIKYYKFFNIPNDYQFSEIITYETGKEYKNRAKSVILAGGSFAYSFGLDPNEQSLAAKLSQYSKRNVIVKAVPATGPNETLYNFSNEELYNQIDEPEYVIYLFIENHFSRMNTKIYSLQDPRIRPMFEIDNDFNFKRLPCNNKWLFLSHIYKYYYLNKYTYDYGVREEEKFIKTMAALKKEINEHWPDTKLVVVRYDEANIQEPFIFDDKYIQKFKDLGIIYLDADEIVFGKSGKRMIGDEYMQEDQHPSVYAFDLLAKKLVQVLKLN